MLQWKACTCACASFEGIWWQILKKILISRVYTKRKHFNAYNWYIAYVYYSVFLGLSDGDIYFYQTNILGALDAIFYAKLAYFSVFQQGWTDFNSF